jgi:N-dimethylarginine dimethylaminohydrolase
MRDFGGQTTVGAVQRVMVCDPLAAGWHIPQRVAAWRELGYLRAPEFEAAQNAHVAMQNALMLAGAEVLPMPEDDHLTLDAVYAHDASLLTDRGAILLRMGKPARSGEPPHHRAFFEALDIPVAGEIAAPGTAEAGDLVWLDSKTLLAGKSDRTNETGIGQLRALLAPQGAEVLTAALPGGDTGFACLHLMSLISLLSEKFILADLDLLPAPVAELLQGRGFELIKIDSTERATLACNVLSLGDNRLLALDENQRTNTRLRAAGFNVRTFPGAELCINGGGGPTCLTRAILRASQA